MVGRDQTIGSLIILVCIIIALVYTVGLFFFGSPLTWSIQFTLIAVPVFLALIAILVLGTWIGWTMATIPPPIEDLQVQAEEVQENEVQEEKKTRKPKFELYKDASGKFRFRLKAANNEIIAVSEAYESKASCQNGIESVKKNASIAKIVDTTT